MSMLVELHSGAYAVMIDPVGARCLQFSDRDARIRVLHEGPDPLLSGIPVLFPVNRIDGGHFSVRAWNINYP